jgi:ribosome production factor 2
VEDPRTALMLYGSRTSQLIKDAITDLHKLKGLDAVKYTRKNDNVAPFESGGEVMLEMYADRSHCSLFTLGTHSKKRPHNLVLGRLFDGRLYDMIEFGLTKFSPIRKFPAATMAQLGNKVSCSPACSIHLSFPADPRRLPVLFTRLCCRQSCCRPRCRP